MLAKTDNIFYNINMEKYLEIVKNLESMFGDVKCELNYFDAYSLLVAVILSAQCTDNRVNQVTPLLFKKYPTANDMSNANIDEVEKIIYTCGFYHNKAKNIISACQDIVNLFGGEVPNNMDDLVRLSGVGRKTANVMLSTFFDVPAIAVDTHVFRVSNRLGISKSTNPIKCEQDLKSFFPKKYWSSMHLLLVFLGRYVCKARKPNCDECKLKKLCEDYNGRN